VYRTKRNIDLQGFYIHRLPALGDADGAVPLGQSTPTGSAAANTVRRPSSSVTSLSDAAASLRLKIKRKKMATRQSGPSHEVAATSKSFSSTATEQQKGNTETSAKRVKMPRAEDNETLAPKLERAPPLSALSDANNVKMQLKRHIEVSCLDFYRLIHNIDWVPRLFQLHMIL